MSLKQIPISKIYSLPTEPLNKVEGRFWFNTDTTSVSGGKLYRCDGTNWVPVNIGSDYVTVKLPDNSTPISLTTYLNNQIGALSEGISEVESEVNNQKNEFNDKVAELQISKANSGVLRCNGGYAVANNVDYPETFSVAFRSDWDFVDTSKKFFPVKMGYSNTYGLGFYGISDSRLRLYVNTADYVSQAIASYSYSTIRTYLNAGINAFVLVITKGADGNFLPKLYVNGNLIENLSTVKVPAFTMGGGEFKLNCYTINSTNVTNGEVAYQDICVFNFDMSEESAPYTLTDYQTGKSIPPSLKNVVVFFGGGKSTNVVSSNASSSWSGNNYILTQASNTATTKAIRYELPLNKGETINISFSDLTGGVMVDGAYGKFDFFNSTSSVVKIISISTETLNEQYTATDNITQIRFTFNCNTVSSVDERVSTIFENFKIIKNGTTLALEDYTINGKVLDASGNKNHATITGNIAGDDDSSIDVFASQLSTGSSDSSDVLSTVFTALSTNNNGNIVDASNVYYEVPGYSGNVEEWLGVYNEVIHHLQYQMTQIGDQGSGVKYRNEDDDLTVNEGFSNVKAEIDSLSSQLSNSSSNSTLTNLPVYNLDGSLAGESKGIQITKTASGKYTLEIITSSGEVNGDGTIPLQPVYDETGNIIVGENKTLRIVKANGAYTIEII